MKSLTMKSLPKALLLAGLIGLSHNAAAATVALGDLMTAPDQTFSYVSGKKTGVVSDTFTFSLSSPSGTEVAWNLLFGGTSFAAEVFNSSHVSVATIPAGTLKNIFFQQGAYSLVVSGNAGTGAKYAFSISAVPEPESYSMMLAGIGLMGFVAARRKV